MSKLAFFLLKPNFRRVWSKYSSEEGTIAKDSELGKKAYIQLESVHTYVETSKNKDNYPEIPVEKEAFIRQAAFAKANNLEI